MIEHKYPSSPIYFFAYFLLIFYLKMISITSLFITITKEKHTVIIDYSQIVEIRVMLNFFIPKKPRYKYRYLKIKHTCLE